MGLMTPKSLFHDHPSSMYVENYRRLRQNKICMHLTWMGLQKGTLQKTSMNGWAN